MSDLANYLELAILEELFNTAQPGITAVTDTRVRLHTDDPGEAGTANLVLTANWSNYAEVVVENDNVSAVRWGVPAGNLVDNFSAISFGTATIPGADVTVKATSVTDQAGNVLMKGPLTTGRTTFCGLATGDIIHSDAHGFANDQKVVFDDAGGTTTLPTGITTFTEFFVINAATDNFQVSATQGGAAVTITADGMGKVGRSRYKIVQDTDPVSFAAGDLDLTLD